MFFDIFLGFVFSVIFISYWYPVSKTCLQSVLKTVSPALWNFFFCLVNWKKFFIVHFHYLLSTLLHKIIVPCVLWEFLLWPNLIVLRCFPLWVSVVNRLQISSVIWLWNFHESSFNRSYPFFLKFCMKHHKYPLHKYTLFFWKWLM